jgi:(4S)-4-hydroxy-5-phosphonooxypentane-2,3-dione isomerase
MHILHIHLKVKPERIDDFIAVTIENAAASLKEPGCVRFDVIQEAEDPARFALVEIYRDQATHAAHRETPHYNAWAERALDMLAEPRSRTIYRNVYPGDNAF